MTGMTMFFTEQPIDGIVAFEGISAGIRRYRYKDITISDLTPIECVLPRLVNYGVRYIDPDLPLIKLAKEYFKKGGKEFIVINIWMGYPTPSHELMPEVVIDIKDTVSQGWPRTFIETLPDEIMDKNYARGEGAEEFLARSPSKYDPWFEYFTKYRLIDSGSVL